MRSSTKFSVRSPAKGNIIDSGQKGTRKPAAGAPGGPPLGRAPKRVAYKLFEFIQGRPRKKRDRDFEKRWWWIGYFSAVRGRISKSWQVLESWSRAPKVIYQVFRVCSTPNTLNHQIKIGDFRKSRKKISGKSKSQKILMIGTYRNRF